MMRAAALLLAAALAACAAHQPRPGGALQPVELVKTPFFPQEDHQCGPAALATVLNADGVDIAPERLTPMVFLPGRKGSLQTELIAATRRQGRVAYTLGGEFSDLQREVESGRPVLVLQNLGAGFWPLWHYAVVIGFDPARDAVILRSGRTARQVMSRTRFLRSWRLAEHWAMVVTRPETIPVTAQIQPWLRHAADLESLGLAELAGPAYVAAAHRWPQEPLAWFAVGNAAYAGADLPAAAAALRRALELAPQDAAARNNLAQVLMEQGCRADAEHQIGIALRDALPEQRVEIERTASAIRAAVQRPVAGVRCETGSL